MDIEIVGEVDQDRLYCAGSFSKLLTTYVSLSRLAEEYDLNLVIDDDKFLDKICTNQTAKDFLRLFQGIIGSQFTIRDLCTFYSGLPYTFDVSATELKAVDASLAFKHHRVLEEETFLNKCRHDITPLYPNRSKFHYSEIAIIFLGYLMEKVYGEPIEDFYQQYVIAPFNLKNSLFSRKIVKDLWIQDFSKIYDYPSIAITDHGYFCYSNGFFTNLHDMKILLEHLLDQPIFNYMVDVKKARAASNRLMNGLTIEMRSVKDDLIYGYEGLSFSGCNIWAYSTKLKKGYLTFTESEEEAYTIIYDQHFGYHHFDPVPEWTQTIYKNFIAHYDFSQVENKSIPLKYQGSYQRVNINDSTLMDHFTVNPHDILIRNPTDIQYDIVSVKDTYRIKGKDNVPGAKVGFMTAKSGHHYMYNDGTLYRKL